MVHNPWGQIVRAAAAAIFLVNASAWSTTPATLPAAESVQHKDARMQWWRDAKFGLFIHWGIYSVPAGVIDGKANGGAGEWIMHNAKVPVARYAAYANDFDPSQFDAKAWVKLAKAAGMKYIVITAKHHDGFAMFHSKASPYNIFDATPFKRDPLAELADACRTEGIKLGFYYSQNLDWHHPGGGTYGPAWDPAQKGSRADYVDQVAVPQVRELLSNYGEFPAVLWWDIRWGNSAEDKESAAKLDAVVRSLRPDLITNNRLGVDFPGDTETPEQFIPATGYPGRDWESCMTMNGTWGFKTADTNWKSTARLVGNLVDIASKGGNYLLNVGPTSQGLIPDASVERLQAIGVWMQANGASIYGTHAGPFRRLTHDLRCTQTDGKLFVHVLNDSKPVNILLPMRGKVTSAALLAKPDVKLAIKSTAAGIEIAPPAAWPDAVDSVIVVEVDGPVDAFVPPLVPDDDGAYRLTAIDADPHGPNLNPTPSAGVGGQAAWRSIDDYYDWPLDVKAAGDFTVSATYAASEKQAGSTIHLVAADRSLDGVVAATGPDGTKFKTVDLGRITFGKAGPQTIALHAMSVKNGPVMTLRSIALVPVRPGWKP